MKPMICSETFKTIEDALHFLNTNRIELRDVRVVELTWKECNDETGEDCQCGRKRDLVDVTKRKAGD